MLFPWGPSPSPWQPSLAFDFDLSTLSRPLEWGFFRVDGRPEEVIVLAPRVVPGGVYGILPRSSPTRFVAIKSPPGLIAHPSRSNLGALVRTHDG